jgi:hypothetical protein
MQKHNIQAASELRPNYCTSTSVPKSPSTAVTSHKPLWCLDPMFSQISQLGLDTAHLKEQYWINRRQALVNLLQELTVIQKLYEGRRLDIEPGGESIQIRAMELNAHLIRTASFGKYAKAEKINILYQLRRAVEMIYSQHFGQH